MKKQLMCFGLAISLCATLAIGAEWYPTYDLVVLELKSLSSNDVNKTVDSSPVYGTLVNCIVSPTLQDTNGVIVTLTTVAGKGYSPLAAKSLYSNTDILTNTTASFTNVICVGDIVRMTCGTQDSNTNTENSVKAWLLYTR